MMAGSHVVLGVAAWMIAAPHLGFSPYAPVSVAVAAGAALIPDVDHPKSWIGRRMRPLSSELAKLLGHRGATHSLLAIFGCVWLLASHGMPRGILAPMSVGYLSHLAADMLTPGGLRLAWPLRGTWSLPLCRTGSWAEPVIVVGLLGSAWWLNSASRFF
jgi:inner membrane protein